MGHPTLDAYLAGLPRGIESFPAVEAKGAIVRAYLEDKPLDGGDESLPPRLRDLIRDPPLAASWIPEVEFLAVASTTRDAHFDSDEAFYAWVRQLNIVATPSMMVGGTTRRWGQFHRGTELSGALGPSGRSAEFVFKYPPNLMTPLHIKLFASAIAAALECSGARAIKSGDVAPVPGGSKIVCDWR